MILRRLPTLVYSDSSSKEADATADPTLTSLYFDNASFELYTDKVERAAEASSLRLRWYGPLSARPEILMEQKVVRDTGVSEEHKFAIKDKYVKPFLDGDYGMEKTIRKLERQDRPADEIEAFRATALSIRDFATGRRLEPLLRANYVRTAYQKPNSDRVRISIDTDLAFIREDALDRRRPARDPDDWHRRDVDNGNMTFPFADLPPSDVSRFPFAVLDVKLKGDAGRRRPAWVEDLMASHLLFPAPRFSKFVHGVATLFDDYVNSLPFWLSDLETDIRRSAQEAFREEEERRARQAQNELVVGSLLGTRVSSFQPSRASPVSKSYLAERFGGTEATATGTPRSYAEGSAAGGAAGGAANGAGDGAGDEAGGAGGEPPNYGTVSSVLPALGLARYARWRRAQQRPRLPEGVVEPTEWIKNMGPLQIEPKVWLANERTFLKWQHIAILLGSLAVALYTAAGRHNVVAQATGLAFVSIAVFAGAWGRYQLVERRRMIVERSGQDFDNMVGPLVVSFALLAALVLNFVFAVSPSLSPPILPSPDGA